MPEIDDVEHWASADQALRWVTTACEDETKGTRELGEHVQAGLVRTRARRVVSRSGTVVGDAQLPTVFWDPEAPARYLGYDPIGRSPPNWHLGRFPGFLPGPGVVDAFGVEFSSADLARWFGSPPPSPSSSEASPPAQDGPSRRGRPRKESSWTRFWLAVLELSEAKRLNVAHFATQKELRDEILLMIDGALSDDTIEDPVRLVWERFVEPKGR